MAPVPPGAAAPPGAASPEQGPQIRLVSSYDCKVALADWWTAWSEDKQVYCCQYMHLGCYDCQGSPIYWSRTQRDSCCRTAGVACAGPIAHVMQKSSSGDSAWRAALPDVIWPFIYLVVGVGGVVAATASRRAGRLARIVFLPTSADAQDSGSEDVMVRLTV